MYWRKDSGRVRGGLPAGKAGFTLVELLVVIAIIGILAAIVTVSLTAAKAKARDAKRREALKTLASALEAYSAQNAAFPPSTASGGWVSSLDNANYIPNLVPEYFNQLPQDSGPACTTAMGYPASTVRAYWYISDTIGTSFKITACAENTVDSSDLMYDHARSGGYVLQVCHGSSDYCAST